MPGSVQLSPDGAVLAFDDSTLMVRLCEFATGKEIHRFEGHSHGCFSPDSKRLATIARDSTIHVWDLATFKPLHRLAGHGDPTDRRRENTEIGRSMAKNGIPSQTKRVAFWSDGNTLVSYGSDQSLRLWGIAGERELVWHQFEGLEFDPFSPDGKMLARFCHEPEGHQVELWNVSRGKRIRALPRQRYQVINCQFSPDARSIALVTQAGNIHVFDVASGQKKCSMITEATYEGYVVASSNPSVVAFSPDEKILASIRDRSLQLWDALTGQELRKLKGTISEVDSLFFTPTKRHSWFTI